MLKEALYLNQLKKYERRLNRNQIEIAHFIPGRIRLKSELWKQNKQFSQHVQTVIKKEPYVCRINCEEVTGSLVIEFQFKEMPSIERVNMWVEQILQVHKIVD
ncbi:MAG: HMA2 domain-containing protein [Bacillus sp. (in: firmicutes)]